MFKINNKTEIFNRGILGYSTDVISMFNPITPGVHKMVKLKFNVRHNRVDLELIQPNIHLILAQPSYINYIVNFEHINVLEIEQWPRMFF